MQLKMRSIVKGIATRVPLFAGLANSSAGGTVTARYCYTVWLRHLVTVTKVVGTFRPQCVAELGPGDSLGVGLAAMLCGANRYYALDRLEFANAQGNLEIFEELVELFGNRSPIPNDSEFPGVYPKLENYEFPSALLDDEWLGKCLDSQRLERIRRLVATAAKSDGEIEIRYFAPWNASATIQPESVDWIFSQAVLEHVDDVSDAYRNLKEWLRPSGLMSHRIDYTCHGLTHDWNGHWTVSDAMWKVVRGQRAYLINRLPHSAHIKAMRNCGMEVVCESITSGPPLGRAAIARRFSDFSGDDLSTAGAFVVARFA